MNAEQRQALRKLIINEVNHLSQYTSGISDTTKISLRLCMYHLGELYNIGILTKRFDNKYHEVWQKAEWHIHSKILKELNMMHDEGRLKKSVEMNGYRKLLKWRINHNFSEPKSSIDSDKLRIDQNEK